QLAVPRARKGDPAPVRRPGRIDLVVEPGSRRRVAAVLRQPVLVAAVPLRRVELVGPIAGGDEDERVGALDGARAAAARGGGDGAENERSAGEQSSNAQEARPRGTGAASRDR